MNLNRLHYWYSSFQYNGNVRNKWELSEILLLPGGAPFLFWCTLCCLEVPFSSWSTLGRMKYPKYHARYHKGAYWYPIGTLISKCVRPSIIICLSPVYWDWESPGQNAPCILIVHRDYKNTIQVRFIPRSLWPIVYHSRGGGTILPGGLPLEPIQPCLENHTDHGRF